MTDLLMFRDILSDLASLVMKVHLARREEWRVHLLRTTLPVSLILTLCLLIWPVQGGSGASRGPNLVLDGTEVAIEPLHPGEVFQPSQGACLIYHQNPGLRLPSTLGPNVRVEVGILWTLDDGLRIL